MGLFAKLRGTERTPEAEAAVERLRASLPDGWELVELRRQMFCRRPVKLYAWGASAEGPAGQRVLTLSADEDGVLAVTAVAGVVAGTASAAPRWAPPPISPREDDRDGWPLHDPESGDEAAARQEALDLLPLGSRPMNVDTEPFRGIAVFAVVAQTPDRLGLAGVGLSRAEAWRALAERLRGELPEADVWVPAAGG
jgi:hypothetical protein